MAPKPPSDEKIDDCRVIISQLPPMKVIDLTPELLSVLAPGLAGLRRIGKLSKGDEVTVEDLAALAVPITGIVNALLNGKAAKLVPELLSTTTVIVPTVDGRGHDKYDLSRGPSEIDRAFQGRLVTLGKVIRRAVEVSFRDFLPVSGLFGGRDETGTESSSTSSSPSITSTG